jgi:hypothetical protein
MSKLTKLSTLSSCYASCIFLIRMFRACLYDCLFLAPKWLFGSSLNVLTSSDILVALMASSIFPRVDRSKIGL